LIPLEEVRINITNSAVIGSDNTPPVTSTRVTPLLGIVDPVIIKGVFPAQARPGEEVVYTIEVFNLPTSTLNATNVQVIDELPDFLDIIEITDVPPGSSVEVVGQRYIVNIGTLAPGERVIFHIRARVNNRAQGGVQQIRNVAALHFNEGSPRNDDAIVSVPPVSTPTPVPTRPHDDDDDDHHHTSPTSIPPTPIPTLSTLALAAPTAAPAPTSPALFLPETGLRESRPATSYGGVLLLLTLGCGGLTLLLYRRRSKK
jgi:uncharacterized repeat protein (TIGR01451 family)